MSETWLCVRTSVGSDYEAVAVYSNEREALAWKAGIDAGEYGRSGFALLLDTNQGSINIAALVEEACHE